MADCCRDVKWSFNNHRTLLCFPPPQEKYHCGSFRQISRSENRPKRTNRRWDRKRKTHHNRNDHSKGSRVTVMVIVKDGLWLQLGMDYGLSQGWITFMVEVSNNALRLGIHKVYDHGLIIVGELLNCHIWQLMIKRRKFKIRRL